jgi:hypothetical protein
MLKVGHLSGRGELAQHNIFQKLSHSGKGKSSHMQRLIILLYQGESFSEQRPVILMTKSSNPPDKDE